MIILLFIYNNLKLKHQLPQFYVVRLKIKVILKIMKGKYCSLENLANGC